MMANLPDLAPVLRSSLQGELVDRISGILRAGGATGSLLREAALARELGVSRTPVRAALRHLVSEGVLEASETGGYTIARIPAPAPAGLGEGGGSHPLYGLIVRDIILSEIPEPTSESALMRRYAVGRGELVRVLRRLVREGLAEPLPGRGWSLIPFSGERLSASYRLRIVLEPAMLDAPGYRIDQASLVRTRGDHVSAMARLDAGTPWQEIFDLDAAFHEVLALGTANDLIVDIVRRQNRLRRLAEYVGYSRLERIEASMSEHVRIVDALLDRNVPWASALLRQHLVVSLEETEAHFKRDLEVLRENGAALTRSL